MYIPESLAARLTALNNVHTTTTPTGGDLTKDGWSSLIGIVTAIVGNILISFALNTQRYAHIRLSREREGKLKGSGRGKSRENEPAGYGTQAEIAEERAKANLRPGYLEDADRQNKRSTRRRSGEEAEEGDPLIPPIRTRSSASSGRQSRERRSSSVKQKSYLRSPYWWIGIILMTVGEAGNFLAYGFAPASIVSPLGVVALISNCIIAPIMLKEPFRKRDFFGVLIAVAGAVTVVLSARDNNPKLGPDDIWHLITTWEFETYLGITIVLIISLIFASERYGEKSIFIDLGLVGLFGGYTALSTKGVASLLSYTLWRALTFPVTYLLVAILVGTAVMQIKYVNRALQRFDATQVIPTQFVLFTLSVIIGSAILYRDFERTPGGEAGKFIGGCALTFLGVWLITSGRPHGHDTEEDTAPEAEEAIHLVDEDSFSDETEDEGDTIERRSSNLSRSKADSDNSARHRRSSHQHIGGTLSHPQSPRIPSMSQPQAPQITLTLRPARDSSESPPPDAHSPFTANPWQPSSDHPPESSSNLSTHLTQDSALPRPRRTPPAALKTTASAPVLPSEAQTLPRRPHTPRNTSDMPATPFTPQQQQQQQQQATGFPTLSRNSIAAGLLPGPYTSPLSASFSAVVADSLRRGVEAPAYARRRAVARLRMPGAGGSEAGGRLVDALAEEGEADGGSVVGRGRGRGRGRSLSGTLGELFWRQRVGDGRIGEATRASVRQDGRE